MLATDQHTPIDCYERPAFRQAGHRPVVHPSMLRKQNTLFGAAQAALLITQTTAPNGGYVLATAASSITVCSLWADARSIPAVEASVQRRCGSGAFDSRRPGSRRVRPKVGHCLVRGRNLAGARAADLAELNQHKANTRRFRTAGQM